MLLRQQHSLAHGQPQLSHQPPMPLALGTRSRPMVAWPCRHQPGNCSAWPARQSCAAQSDHQAWGTNRPCALPPPAAAQKSGVQQLNSWARSRTLPLHAASVDMGLPQGGTPNMFEAAYMAYKRFWELSRKFMPMVALFFLLAVANTILDSLKDTLVITAVGGGAQVVPFLTVYAVLPSSLLFLFMYSHASQHLSRAALFNAIVGTFMAFFVVFAFVLYPNAESLHLHSLADRLGQVLPAGMEGAVGMVRNWLYTVFFCVAELWGDVCLGLLFWGLANESTQLADAPTLYPLFGLGANMAQALAGTLLKVCSQSAGESLSFGSEIQALMMVVLVVAGVALVLHSHIDGAHRTRLAQATERRALRLAAREKAKAEEQAQADEQALLIAQAHAAANSSMSDWLSDSDSEGCGAQEVAEDQVAAHVLMQLAKDEEARVEAAKKAKPSVREVFQTLSASVPIRCLALMSLSQGLCTSLMEFAWKSHISLLYPSPAQFTSFLGDVSLWQGVVTGLLMLLSPAMFARMGWLGVASATPFVLLTGGTAFFLTCLVYQWGFATHAAAAVGHSAASLVAGSAAAAEQSMAGVTGGMGGTMLQGLVYGGALLFVFGKSAKFSLFKPAEEMVYISLDEEGRTKGKAAIDVVGSQAGKSFGSMLQQALLLASGGMVGGILPFMGFIYFAFAQGWLNSVSTLAPHANYGHVDSIHDSLDKK